MKKPLSNQTVNTAVAELQKAVDILKDVQFQQSTTMLDFVTWLPDFFKLSEGTTASKIRDGVILYAIFTERHKINMDILSLLNTTEFGIIDSEEDFNMNHKRPLVFSRTSLSWFVSNGFVEPIAEDLTSITVYDIVLTEKCKALFIDKGIAFDTLASIYPKIQEYKGQIIVTDSFQSFKTYYNSIVNTMKKHIEMIDVIDKCKEKGVLLPPSIIMFLERYEVFKAIDNIDVDLLNCELYRIYDGHKS